MPTSFSHYTCMQLDSILESATVNTLVLALYKIHGMVLASSQRSQGNLWYVLGRLPCHQFSSYRLAFMATTKDATGEAKAVMLPALRKLNRNTIWCEERVLCV